MYSYEIWLMIVKILAGGAATFYLAYAVTQTSGMFDVFEKARARAHVFECFTCVAFWAGVAAAIALYVGLFWLVVPLALAGLAQAVHNATR